MPRVLCSPSCEAVLWYKGLGLHGEDGSALNFSRTSYVQRKSPTQHQILLSQCLFQKIQVSCMVRKTLADEGMCACHAVLGGQGLESCLSPDRVETRVNSVAASMLRSRFTCCSSPCTGSVAL